MVSSKIIMPGCSSSSHTPRCLGDDIHAVGANLHGKIYLLHLRNQLPKHTCFAFQTLCVSYCSHKQYKKKVHQNNARHPPAPLTMYWHVPVFGCRHVSSSLTSVGQAEVNANAKRNRIHQKPMVNSGVWYTGFRLWVGILHASFP